MSPEFYNVSPRNQVLAELQDIHGQHVGGEIIKRVLESEIFIVLGEPAIGKSTVVGQIADELHVRNVPFEIVSYDDILDNHIKDSGVHEEDNIFNAILFHEVLNARMRMEEVGGIVIFDTCAVGSRSPKDRSITAVEDLVRFAQDGNRLFSKLQVLALVGSLRRQHQNANMRFQIMATPSSLVVDNLLQTYNITLEKIPDDISPLELGTSIKDLTRRSARVSHIVRISREIASNIPNVVRELGLAEVYNIFVPASLTGGEIFHLQLRAADMIYRARMLDLTDDCWLTAINPEQNGPVTWYGYKFLRRDAR